MVQVEIIKKVCPMSGWLTNKKTIKDKIRIEMNKGLKKEKLINDEDKDLILKFYKKIQNELEDLETN